MCGVIATLAYNELESREAERRRQETMIFLSTKLLQLTETRGKDATGISTLFRSGDFMGLKMGVTALEFISRFGKKKTDFQGYLDVWRRKKADARIVIGHCRKPSVGTAASANDNVNNHPIRVGNIVGVHNGTLTNHENIFKNLQCSRDGKVDSEAIIRLLDYLTHNGQDPFSKEVITETCRRLTGNYAVLAFNANNPYQLAAFRDSRPLEIALIRPMKLALIASEKVFLQKAIMEYNANVGLFRGTMGDRVLCKGDVTMGSMPDDHQFLFDIRKDVTAETTTDDLFQKERIIRNNKVWSGEKKTTTMFHNRNRSTVGAANPQTPAAGQSGAKQPCTIQMGTCTHEGASDAHPGRIWNKATNSYISKDLIDDSTADKNIEMDCNETGKIKSAEKETDTTTETASSVELTKTERDLDTLPNSPAKIEVVDVETSKLAIVKSNKTTKTVDMGVDVDAISNAVEFAQKHPSFSNNIELAQALEITDVESMKAMTQYSLANRLKGYFMSKGYLAGVKAGQKATVEKKPTKTDVVLDASTAQYRNDMMARMRNQVESSRAIIRNLKTLLSIFDETSDGVTSKSLAYTVKGVVEDGKEADVNILSKAIKPGDLKKMPNVAAVFKLLE